MPQTTQTPPAWTPEDLASNPHGRADKPRRVRAMFGAIAGKYDLNNRLHSFGRDQAWRRVAVKMAQVQPGDEILDMACGTGDLTQLFAEHPNTARVVGGDFTVEMLEVARHKLERMHPDHARKVEYVEADAMALPFDDASFDVVSIAFGIRNVQDPAGSAAEFARVLRPGGRLVILEFDTPGNAPMRFVNDLYCKRIMPWTATLISGDRSGAYRYLPKSVGSFLTAQQLRELVERVGFTNARSRALTMGICACTVATRSA